MGGDLIDVINLFTSHFQNSPTQQAKRMMERGCQLKPHQVDSDT